MQAHVHSRAANAEEKLWGMDHRDLDTATSKATTRYNRHLGKRARPNTVHITLSKLDEVRKNQEPVWRVPKHPAKKVKVTQHHQTVAVEVHNPFQALSRRGLKTRVTKPCWREPNSRTLCRHRFPFRSGTTATGSVNWTAHPARAPRSRLCPTLHRD